MTNAPTGLAARVAWEFEHRPDLAISVALAGGLLACSLMYLPGHAASVAWRNFDNPILYADRFAFPELFPNDRIASHLRDLYPLLSVVHLAPALLLKYLAVPPQYVTFVEVAVNDPLMVLAVYWLSRGLGLARDVSVFAALFTVTSRVLSWNLAGYEYFGHDFPYSGSLYIPFAVAVIPSLIYGRVRLALVFSALAAAVFAPAGGLMAGVVFLYLTAQREIRLWRIAAPCFALPALALAWAAAVQTVITARIKERFTYVEDVAVVMVNGHFVPYWISGQAFGSPYLGFFIWCGLTTLAWRHWRGLTPQQRLPIAILAGVVAACLVLGLLAVALGWLFVLRLGMFRYSLLLAVVAIPFVVAYLVEKLRGADTASRIAAGLLLVLLLVDRGTAWMLPVILPCLVLLAVHDLNGGALRWARQAIAVLCALTALDLLLHLGVSERLAALIDSAGQIGALLAEASRRLQPGGRELAYLFVAALGVFLLRRWPASASSWSTQAKLIAGLCVFALACIVTRAATQGVWAATGPPAKLAEAERWAKVSTHTAAKFLFFEIEPDGSWPSWQTLSQRGAAEMLYTHQKAYLPDRELLAIDRLVSAHYGINHEEVAANPYPYSPQELHERYTRFSIAEFLLAAHRSGSSFVVLKRPQAVAFPVAYANPLFVIYRVPARFQDVQVSATRLEGASITVAWDAAARPARRLQVEFRDAVDGQVIHAQCCVTIGESAGEHTFQLPQKPARASLAMVAVIDAETGRRLPLDGDTSGEQLAFWEYLVPN